MVEMRKQMSNLRLVELIKGAGHWVQHWRGRFPPRRDTSCSSAGPNERIQGPFPRNRGS
jgi:hypothetical protein